MMYRRIELLEQLRSQLRPRRRSYHGDRGIKGIMSCSPIEVIDAWVHMNCPKKRIRKEYDIEVQLTGEDGNAFAIMGRVHRALVEAGVKHAELNEFRAEATSGDYDNLLRVCHKWVIVK